MYIDNQLYVIYNHKTCLKILLEVILYMYIYMYIMLTYIGNIYDIYIYTYSKYIHK